jgi:ubiquinone/menaquinone biosynthesis C-methylase UbiE
MVTVDLGCGDNKASPYFIGVDKRQTQCTNYVLDAENLSTFKDDSINALYTERMLQHVPNDLKVLQEISRILTNDGIAIIEVASTTNAWITKILNFFNIKVFGYYKVFHAYNKQSLTKKIEAANLKILSYGRAPTRFGLWNHLFVVTKNEVAVS